MLQRPSSTYDASDLLVQTPLTLDQVQALLASGGAELRGRNLTHFLQRVVATVKDSQDRARQMQRHMTTLEAEARRAHGITTSLNPLDAIKFLSPEQKRLVFDGMERDRLDALEARAAELEQVRRDAVRQRGRARALLLAVAEEPSVPAALRQRAQAFLEAADDDQQQPAPEPDPASQPTGGGEPPKPRPAPPADPADLSDLLS